MIAFIISNFLSSIFIFMFPIYLLLFSLSSSIISLGSFNNLITNVLNFASNILLVYISFSTFSRVLICFFTWDMFPCFFILTNYLCLLLLINCICYVSYSWQSGLCNRYSVGLNGAGLEVLLLWVVCTLLL